MKTPTAENMVKYIDRLNAKEQAVICLLARHSGRFEGRGEIHQGLLPFLPVKEVIILMKTIIGLDAMGQYKRTCNRILMKLSEANEPEGKTTFLMKLNHAKVYKQFGRNPERGKPLPYLQKVKVTVGLKWSLPKKQWLPDKDVLVTPCVTLKRADDRSNYWVVTTLWKCRPAVELWLQQYCQ